ncbi:hypothetical protein F5D26_18055 [Burkholderia pseudomallei]|nr:hypothetical protein F5D26_18055 [Burkholderia pseudomallei]
METHPAFAGGRSRPIWRVRPVLIRGLKEAVKNGFFNSPCKRILRTVISINSYFSGLTGKIESNLAINP